MSATKTILDILSQRVIADPNHIGFRQIRFFDNSETSLTYAELVKASSSIAQKLISKELTNNPILILLPQCLDYITALFGIFYSGNIAVTAYPPKKNSKDNRIQSIVKNCAPKLIIGYKSDYDSCKTANQYLLDIPWIILDEFVYEDIGIELIDAKLDDIAVLQYTSGSTGNPKGVMVSHRNIVSNSEVIKQGFSFSKETRKCTWLPFFHDMGLIGDIIQPIYTGFQNIFMSPREFIQKPIRWLNIIHEYKITHSGGPNFGYDICSQKILDEECSNLDLSSWKLAYTGAEFKSKLLHSSSRIF